MCLIQHQFRDSNLRRTSLSVHDSLVIYSYKSKLCMIFIRPDKNLMVLGCIPQTWADNWLRLTDKHTGPEKPFFTLKKKWKDDWDVMVWGYHIGKIPIISHQAVSKTSCGAGGGWGLPVLQSSLQGFLYLWDILCFLWRISRGELVVFSLVPGLQVGNKGGMGKQTESQAC